MTDTLARTSGRTESRNFYFTMALICVAIAFIGFAPSYWAPMAKGAFHEAPIYHLHGLVFFSWTVYFAFQTWLVPSGRTALHRSVGLIGISLSFTLALVLGGLAGYYGGWIDMIVQRITEIIKSFPHLPLWLALACWRRFCRML